MKTISLKIPDEVVSRMDAVSQAKRTSRSAYLREVLEQALKKESGLEEPSLFARSADLCGSGESGHTDLATNSKHMEGFGE